MRLFDHQTSNRYRGGSDDAYKVLFVVAMTFQTAPIVINGASAQERTRPPFMPRAIALAPTKRGVLAITVSSPDFANQNYQDKGFVQTRSAARSTSGEIAIRFGIENFKPLQ
jgi:hypothetical protein